MDDKNGLMCSRRSRSSTPAFVAAVYMSSSKMSHPVKTRSFRAARGTKSRTAGELLSVRLPKRIVPIWVNEPIGFATPLRTASTPATNVVATAPMPGIITPSFPLAGIRLGCRILLAFRHGSSLPYEDWTDKATCYVLVGRGILQPDRPEWK